MLLHHVPYILFPLKCVAFVFIDLNEDLYFLPVLPKKLSSFWGHVLKRVCTADNNFLTNLSRALLECVHIDVHSTRDVVRYGGWIQFILQDFRQDNSKCVISWGDLLHSCKSNPGPLSAGVMKIITENLKNTSLYSATRLAQLLAASELLTLSERVALCLPPRLDSVKLKGNEEFVVDLISVVERAKKRGHHTDGDVEEQKIFRPDNSMCVVCTWDLASACTVVQAIHPYMLPSVHVLDASTHMKSRWLQACMHTFSRHT